MKKNRKVLVFGDEFITKAPDGSDIYGFGLLICDAAIAAKLDAHVVHGLSRGVGEIHSASWSENALVDILERLQQHPNAGQMVLLHKAGTVNGPAPEAYARNLMAALTTGLHNFKRQVKGWDYINNVELVLDRCEANQHPNFRGCLFGATSGVTKAIEHCEVIDSCVSRLLQVADIVAYANSLRAKGFARVTVYKEPRFADCTLFMVYGAR